MSRWKASGIHLAISLAIALIVGTLLLIVWYPPPYFHGAGADELVLLLVGVDIGLGPLITLIIFRSGKKGLKFDLTVIAALQTVALVYGLWVVLGSRPVFLVAAVDRFTLVSANELDPEDLKKASKLEFQTLSWTGPRLVAAKLPTDAAEHNEILMSGLGGKDIDKFPKYYVDYQQNVPALLIKAHSLESLRKAQPGSVSALDTYLKRAGLDDSGVVWLPLIARKQSMVMLLSRSTGQPLKALMIDPW